MPTSTTVQQRRRQETLVRQAAGLVRPIAQSYARQSRECVDDLNQVGLLGMVRAAQLYDSSLGVPFDAFARPHVRGAILHYLRDLSPLVRLPRRQNEWRQKLVRDWGDPGSQPAPQTATAQQERLATLQQWAALSRPLPLEAIDDPDQLRCYRITDGSDETLEPLQGGTDYAPPGLNPGWQNASIQRMLGLVDRRKQMVLRRVVLKGWSYRRTARSLGTSAPTVQRLLHAALAELRQGLIATTTVSGQDQNGRHRAPSGSQGW
ncbi:MAG: sigma-70 family RNA polymerase sigma factor [Cyanobacteriota bacterium]|nr:sigma-70 family RNA polymerase sigma factor [Cyanobacteriota bacterium]